MSGHKRSQDTPLFSPDPVSASPVVRSAQVATIDMLPDDVLLEIFDSYKGTTYYSIPERVWSWQTLAHVCRRWRNIILESPRHLDLRITCTHRTPTREYLDIWPPFPISITSFGGEAMDAEGEDNIIAALEQRDRIFQISMSNLTSSVLERFVALMEEPIPALRHIHLSSLDATAAALPDAFLGRSAPRLRSFVLQNIAFPALPNLISSANLDFLYLFRIPHTGYISPPAMVTVLLALPNLNSFIIEFLSPQSRPLGISPPSRTCAILPALISFEFRGTGEYLVDFVGRIDTPLLERLEITLFLDLVFDIPQLKEFIDRTERFKSLEQVDILLSPQSVKASLRSAPGLFAALTLGIACRVPDWQISSMGRVCNQLSPLLSQVERLDILDLHGDRLEWQDDNDADSTQWLDLLIPFVSVKSLYVSEILGPLLARSLQELDGERVTEILPTLQNVFLEGLQPSETELEAMKAFVAARQFSDHPIVIQRWERTPESPQSIVE